MNRTIPNQTVMKVKEAPSIKNQKSARKNKNQSNHATQHIIDQSPKNSIILQNIKKKTIHKNLQNCKIYVSDQHIKVSKLPNCSIKTLIFKHLKRCYQETSNAIPSQEQKKFFNIFKTIWKGTTELQLSNLINKYDPKTSKFFIKSPKFEAEKAKVLIRN